MNQTQSIFGWSGANEIFEILRQEFDETECKKIYNILFFKIQTIGNNKKPINQFKQINNLLPDQYIEEKKNGGKKTIISYLYETKYSAHDKINRLKKYADLLNCKYCTSLKINFHYGNRGYTYLMYFGDPSKDNIEVSKLNSYLDQWNRMKNKFTLEPKVHLITPIFFVKVLKPDVPWIAPIDQTSTKNKLKYSYDTDELIEYAKKNKELDTLDSHLAYLKKKKENIEKMTSEFIDNSSMDEAAFTKGILKHTGVVGTQNLPILKHGRIQFLEEMDYDGDLGIGVIKELTGGDNYVIKSRMKPLTTPLPITDVD